MSEQGDKDLDIALSNKARDAWYSGDYFKAVEYLDKMTNRVIAIKMERLINEHRVKFGNK